MMNMYSLRKKLGCWLWVVCWFKMKFEVFVFKFVTAGRQFKAPLKKDKDLDAHQVRLSYSKPHIMFFKYLALRSL